MIGLEGEPDESEGANDGKILRKEQGQRRI
jgi:hypothetical protein